MNEKTTTPLQPESSSGTATAYIAGFVFSLTLTLLAYLLVRRHINSHHLIFSDSFLIAAISVLAVTQLFVQLVFFLHLDRESKPRWNNTVLAFAAMVVLVLVFGSLWIMTNLNYHHGTHNVTHDGHKLNSSQQTTQYIIQDEGIKQP